MRRQRENINPSEYVIKRPLYWVVALSFMLLAGFVGCLAPGGTGPYDDLEELFYSITGFSIWLFFTVIVFVLLVMQLYIFLRFKLVIHRKGFSVTPIWGATHDIPFSAVKRVTHKRFSKKGAYIEIEYENKKVLIPYVVNWHGEFKQKGFEVLLRKFEDYQITVNEEFEWM